MTELVTEFYAKRLYTISVSTPPSQRGNIFIPSSADCEFAADRRSRRLQNDLKLLCVTALQSSSRRSCGTTLSALQLRIAGGHSRPGMHAWNGMHVLRPKSSLDPGSSWVVPRTYRVTACRMIRNLNAASSGHLAPAASDCMQNGVESQYCEFLEFLGRHGRPMNFLGRGSSRARVQTP